MQLGEKINNMTLKSNRQHHSNAGNNNTTIDISALGYTTVGDLPKLKEVWRWVKNLVSQYIKMKK